MSDVAATAQGVVYGYADDVVLDGVDLTLSRGKVMGFLGRNGAGKSTTIKLLAGAHQPHKGTVKIGSDDAMSVSARARVGWAPEEPPLYDDLTVAEHLALASNCASSLTKSTSLSTRKGRTASQLIESLSLGDVQHRLARALSKGTRQRTGLAMALIGAPDVLLLDEPSAGLDPAQVKALHALVREDLERGAAVLWSTHVLAELRDVADDVTGIAHGKTIATGDIASLSDIANAVFEGASS